MPRSAGLVLRHLQHCGDPYGGMIRRGKARCRTGVRLHNVTFVPVRLRRSSRFAARLLRRRWLPSGRHVLRRLRPHRLREMRRCSAPGRVAMALTQSVIGRTRTRSSGGGANSSPATCQLPATLSRCSRRVPLRRAGKLPPRRAGRRERGVRARARLPHRRRRSQEGPSGRSAFRDVETSPDLRPTAPPGHSRRTEVPRWEAIRRTSMTTGYLPFPLLITSLR